MLLTTQHRNGGSTSSLCECVACCVLPPLSCYEMSVMAGQGSLFVAHISNLFFFRQLSHRRGAKPEISRDLFVQITNLCPRRSDTPWRVSQKIFFEFPSLLVQLCWLCSIFIFQLHFCNATRSITPSTCGMRCDVLSSDFNHCCRVSFEGLKESLPVALAAGYLQSGNP